MGSRTRAQQLGLAQKRLAEVIDQERPDVVLVRGDTNATLSGARAAAAAGVPLVHVEAGLRSRRKDMPEESNRVQTDRLAQLLLAPTAGARRNLLDEELAGEIHVTGDPLCDTLEQWRARIQPAGGDYLLATVHRNYNTDHPERLQEVLACLARSPWPVLMPLHPRTRARIAEWDLQISPWVRLLAPVSYSRMLALGARRQCDRHGLRGRAARGIHVGRALSPHFARGDRVDGYGQHGLEHARGRRCRCLSGGSRPPDSQQAPADFWRRPRRAAYRGDRRGLHPPPGLAFTGHHWPPPGGLLLLFSEEVVV